MILVKIATEQNSSAIIDELRCGVFSLLFFLSVSLIIHILPPPGNSEYVTDVSATTARHAILSIGQISATVGSSLGHAMEKLLSFTDLDIEYVTAGTLVAVRGQLLLLSFFLSFFLLLLLLLLLCGFVISIIVSVFQIS